MPGPASEVERTSCVGSPASSDDMILIWKGEIGMLELIGFVVVLWFLWEKLIAQ